MRYEVFPDTDGIDVWRAEAVDHDSEGECYVVIFSGPESERRAREYTAWMNHETIPLGLPRECLGGHDYWPSALQWHSPTCPSWSMTPPEQVSDRG